MGQYGACIYNENEAVITIMVGEWGYRLNNNTRCGLKFNLFSKIEILRSFAHELSHLKLYYDDHDESHTPLRQIVESVIMISFMELLIEDGYENEEKETARLRRKNAKV